jgi:hypothetical protein
MSAQVSEVIGAAEALMRSLHVPLHRGPYDDQARMWDRLGARSPESFPAPRHALACETCLDTGLIDWAPGQQQNTDEDQQACPDCDGKATS